MEKQRRSLRQQMRRARRALTPAQQRSAAHNLLGQVRHRLWFLKARHVALYLPNDGEIDPSPLIQLCWKMKKRVYLPVLHPIRHNRLWFLPYTPSTRMCRNRFRILEPKLKYHPRRPGWAMDLVMLPLVAFDAAGNRMGMGGGFYDRTFSYKFAEKGIKGARLIGLAHDFQRVGELPVQPWDVPLFGIVTDRAAYLCQR
ncbi:5-formyltetrahydrofolate cyclo-ligase [Marinobacterium sp. D7]|nr:5-formyltetrahydrofolate cyclo-ligase [Marinobacterium ramblicola]